LRALTEGEHGVAGVGAEELEALKNYRVLQGNYRDRDLLSARTGYTGEDGFERYLPAERAAEVWPRLTEAAGPGLTPCGLGWPAATPCAWRPGCRCTATRSTATCTPPSPGWDALWR